MHVRVARRPGRGRQAAHLRAAALLRGVPARAALHRGAGHHRADLRHLPGRLPDELMRGDGGRVRRRGRRPGARAAAAALLRRVDREPRAARLHAPRAGLPRLRERLRDGARPPRDRRAGRCSSRRRATSHARRRRARDPPDQRPRRRLLPRADAGRARAGGRAARARPRVRDRGRELHRVAAVPGLRRGLRLPRAARRGRVRDRGWTAGVEHRARPRAVASTTSTSSRSTSSTRPRCTRSLRDGTRYLVGPLARYALNRDRLSPAAREAADAAGLEPVCRNPFRSIVVRAVEIVYALDEALRLLDAYEPPDPPAVEVVPRAGVGSAGPRRRAACSGTATRSTTTARSSRRGSCLRPRRTRAAIEQSLHGFVQQHVELADDELHLRCEQAVRSYDPCISCATHFLRLEVDRG